jgi:hypothetical protein
VRQADQRRQLQAHVPRRLAGLPSIQAPKQQAVNLSLGHDPKLLAVREPAAHRTHGKQQIISGRAQMAFRCLNDLGVERIGDLVDDRPTTSVFRCRRLRATRLGR